jgi:hypothetical protein
MDVKINLIPANRNIISIWILVYYCIKDSKLSTTVFLAILIDNNFLDVSTLL